MLRLFVFSIYILIFGFTSITAAAEEPAADSTEAEVPIILVKKQDPSKYNRCPTMPVYGYYGRGVLRVDLLSITTGDADCTISISGVWMTITAAGLMQGVYIGTYESSTCVEIVIPGIGTLAGTL